jgi:hypothetical protein
MEQIPRPVRDAVSQWVASGKPRQPPIQWDRERWIVAFPERADTFSRLPDRLDRVAVGEAAADASRSPGAAVEAFLAVMAWGFGMTGYGPYRTTAMLSSQGDADRRLRAIARAVIRDGPAAGYRALATTSNLPGLGTSFGSKVLYYFQPSVARPRALILDAFVTSWLSREVAWRIDIAAWSMKGYDRYLDSMHKWAEALDLAPDELEMCLFREEATLRGSQWGAAPARGDKLHPVPAIQPDRVPPGSLPFDRYPGAGRSLLGPPPTGDGTARHGYGLQALPWAGYRCAYCGLDMSTFEGWLQLSIDHVVPQQMVGAGYPREWILDAINVVAACGACNGYFNRDPVLGDPPTTLDGFCALRDRVFVERRERILKRRQVERAWFDAHVDPGRKA